MSKKEIPAYQTFREMELTTTSRFLLSARVAISKAAKDNRRLLRRIWELLLGIQTVELLQKSAEKVSQNQRQDYQMTHWYYPWDYNLTRQLPQKCAHPCLLSHESQQQRTEPAQVPTNTCMDRACGMCTLYSFDCEEEWTYIMCREIITFSEIMELEIIA